MSDRYRFGPVIGTGATSRVHRGQDARTGRAVALKVVDTSSPLNRARVLRELCAHRRLEGTAAVALHAAEAHVDSCVLVLELAEGTRLDELVGQGPAAAAKRGAAIARAAATLHARGVVHRDLMPLNLVELPDGSICVLDLGSAASPEWQRIAPAHLEAKGSPGFAAPEQLRGCAPHPTADVYSIGKTVANLDPTVATPLTAPDPEARPQTALDAAAVLDELAGSPSQ